MNDNLDTLNDAQLSEVFAVEYLGWVGWLERRGEYTYYIWQRPGDREPWKRVRFEHQEELQKRFERAPVGCFDPMKHVETGWPTFATSSDAVLPYVEKFAGHIFERCFDYKKPHVARILPSLMYRETYRQEFRGQSTTLARAICIALILAKRAEKGGAR